MTDVLVTPRDGFDELPRAGAWPVDRWPSSHHWLPRALAETDENWLQWIPYVLFTGADGSVWCYRRSGGDRRLAGVLSCGVGGHVERCDEGASVAEKVYAAARREVAEEIHGGDTCTLQPTPLAFLYEGHSAVGRVHLGVVYIAAARDGAIEVHDGEALQPLGFIPLRQVVTDPRFELWSRLAAEFLIGHAP